MKLAIVDEKRERAWPKPQSRYGTKLFVEKTVRTSGAATKLFEWDPYTLPNHRGEIRVLTKSSTLLSGDRGKDEKPMMQNRY